MTEEPSPGNPRPGGEQDLQPQRFRYDRAEESISVAITRSTPFGL